MILHPVPRAGCEADHVVHEMGMEMRHHHGITLASEADAAEHRADVQLARARPVGRTVASTVFAQREVASTQEGAEQPDVAVVR